MTYDLCDTNDTSGWVRQTVDLSAYAGQTIQLQFRAETDSSENSNWFVDDVALGSFMLVVGEEEDSVQAPVCVDDPACADLHQ